MHKLSYNSLNKCTTSIKCRYSYQKVKFCTAAVHYRATADNDLLHRSIVKTDHFQPSLPRLPIPKLEDTCNRYLKAQKPLLDAEQHENTTNIVNRFQQNEGQDLHKELVAKDKANKHTSYISGPWFDMYLKYRDPIVLNHNPFMGFHDDPKPSYNEQILRATNIVISSLRFMKTLRANKLRPEVFHLNPGKTDNPGFWKKIKWVPKNVAFYAAAGLFKVFPLDISQYGRLFNTSRIPRREKDELFTNESARNLIVIRKGHLYTLNILDKDNNILDASEIYAHLQHIKSLDTAEAEHPLAVMTAEHRDTWADTRRKLMLAGNEELLRTIDGALFVLVIDDKHQPDEVAISKSFLHGDGTNRWFDKSFSLLSAPDGKVSVNMEHAWGDGVAVVRYMNEVFADSTQNPQLHPDSKPASIDSAAAVRRLDFNLPDEVKHQITESRKKFQESVDQLNVSFLKFMRGGKNFVKKQKLSPDSFMQLAFQMGFYRQYGHTIATYESCSTAAFRHGRTETIRPATTITKDTCDKFLQTTGSLPSLEELRASLEDCSKVHGQLTKEAAMGQGFDRHLFGMKSIASESGGALPALYQDPAYARINHNVLSTSTLSSPAIMIGGFAPVVPDGFGVGYMPQDDWLGLNVSSYPTRDVDGFLAAVDQSFSDMFDVLEGTDFRK